jgi:short-subunit dehydrogenase
VPPALGYGIARGEAALVTGASSGIGETFARVLAARGVNLLITAHPRDRQTLERISAELAARHGVGCVAVTVDLARRDAPDELLGAADECGFEPDLLINNAGIGSVGPFSSVPLEAQLRTLHVNVEAPIGLTRLYLPRMSARGTGAIINVASTAALQPQPYFAVYAASKAFTLRFGEALWAEQRRSGVRIVTVCPGHVGAGARRDGGIGGFLKPRYLTADQVVGRGLQAVEHDQPVVILRMPLVGRAYHLRRLISGMLTRRARLRAAEWIGRRLYVKRT